MKTIRHTLDLTLALLLAASNTLGQEKPALREIDRVRLAEAFNVGDAAERIASGPSTAEVARSLLRQEVQQ